MKYRCKTCGKGFDLPAPTALPRVPTTNLPWPSYEGSLQPTNVTYNYTISVPCCPHCYSTDIEEAE